MQKESFRRRLGGRLSRLGRSSQAPGETSIQPSSRPQANPNVGMDLAPMTEPATTAAKPPSVNQASGGTRESTTTKDDKSQTQSNQSGAHTVDGKYGFNPKQSTFSDDFGSLTISSDPWDIPQAVSSLGTKERTGPGSSRMPPRFCRLCLAIDLLNIPPEDANGYPHYQSVLELEASALSCSMCRLLLDAGRQRAEDVKLTGKAEWVTTIPAPKGGDGSVMEEDKHGAYLPDVMLPKEVKSNEVVRDHHKAHHAEPSTDPTVLRPWIYGNWYLPDDWSPSKGKVFSHLTGIGVRFSAGPAPDIRKEKNGKYTMSYQGSYIRVCTGDGNKYSAVIPGRLREQDSSSDIAIQRLREWVGWCDNNHRCSTAVIDDPPLPTRVLDLGRLGDESRIVTLLHSNGKHGRYVALSHCWGKSPRTVLTSATMEDLKSPGIAISYLPKTFRDAVNLTRKLGVRYLWVDSFCILQDSVTDWEQEGKRMSDVYAQAYLTISASASKDSFSGCFPSRDATYIPPDVLTLGASTRRDPSKPVTIKHAEMEPPHRVFAELHFFPEWMPSSTANAKKVYQIGTFGRSFDPLLKEHISTRAWTVQERLLSPRTLHFATDQMYWECRCNILSEDGALFQPSFFSTDLLLETQMIKFEDHGMQGSGISFIEGDWPSIKGRGQRWRGGWLAHTVGFCQRNMTNEQDKLPALSGIARFLAQKTGDRYLAGLWKSHLLEDLHWRTYEREESRVHGSSGFELYVRDVKLCDVVRPKEYRAPTWSWASLDSHILFNELSFKHIVAEVIDCQTTPAGIDPYGRVSGGFLKIKAPLFQVSPLSSAYIPWVKHGTPVQINLPNAASISASSAKIPYPHSHISVGTANFDFGPSFPCIALFLDAANCLLLRQSRNGQTFERIGIAQFCRPSFSRIKNREVPAPKRLGKNEKVTLDDVLHVRLGASGPKGTWGPITEEHEKRVVTIV